MVSNGLTRQETILVNDRVNRDILDKLNKTDCTALTLAFHARTKKNTARRHLIALSKAELVTKAYQEGQTHYWTLTPRGELLVSRITETIRR